MHLHIAFAADGNYVPHLAAALVSLFETNSEFQAITVHLLSDKIPSAEQNRLQNLVQAHHRNLAIYELHDTLHVLQKKYAIPATISIAAYSRLFLSQFIAGGVDKIIYADCDSLFLGSLAGLWNTPFSGNLILGVKDHVGQQPRSAVNLTDTDAYINSGFLFIDLNHWRQINAEGIMIDYIAARNGKVNHHDQGVINGCFHEFIGHLHPRYNVMTSFYDFDNVESIRAFYGAVNFYDQAEIDEAKENPVFLHLTPSFSKRPWIEGSRHPLKNRYWEYVAATPWQGMKPQKDRRPLLQKTLEKFYWMLGPVLWKKIFAR